MKNGSSYPSLPYSLEMKVAHYNPYLRLFFDSDLLWLKWLLKLQRRK